MDGIRGTPKEWGIPARDVVEYNHTRAFQKVLTPTLHVAVWYSSTQDKQKPWCIAYFFRVPTCVDAYGVVHDNTPDLTRYETYNFATFDELKAAHPFRFSEFEADLRYPMERMRQ